MASVAAWEPATAADVALVVLALSVPSALLVLAVVARGYDVLVRLSRRDPVAPPCSPTGGQGSSGTVEDARARPSTETDGNATGTRGPDVHTSTPEDVDDT